MARKEKPVPEEVRAKLFLWCERYCCFCGKACTTNIEIHHIDGNRSNNDEDNLMPVCFDCHGELVRYNPKHPRGSKYQYLEIKTRRDQIYELHTLKYVRRAEIRISRFMHHSVDPKTGKPRERQWGDVSCTVRTLSEDIPTKLRLEIKPFQDKKPLNVQLGDIYSGKRFWNLNPFQVVYGHFELPIKEDSQPFNFRVEINWSIIDVLEREHKMLPFGYVWSKPEKDWWFDPYSIDERVPL